MNRFSFCIITKNEEKNIEDCLKPLAKTGMEIVVLDTGSTDHTVELSQKYTDKVYHFDWINDFSAARNYAAKMASNDFILFIDADEITEEINVKKIIQLANTYPKAVGQLKSKSICFNPDNAKELTYVCDVERFYDRRHFHYSGTIHEQVTDGTDHPLPVYSIPLTILHRGYCGTEEERRAKANRNNILLFEELENNPEDPYLYYQIAQSFGLCGDSEKEYYYYQKGCSLPIDSNLPYVQEMLISYGYAMLSTKRNEEALLLERYLPSLRHYADFVCMLGCVYLANNELLKAIQTFRLALTAKQYRVEGSNNGCPHHNLGCIYEALGNKEKALFHFKKALETNYSSSRPRYEALVSTPDFGIQNLTLVIPCHNNEKELFHFLECLEIQTLGFSNFIILFVDCDSKDRTWQMLSQFEKDHSESVILIPAQGDFKDNYFESFCRDGLAQQILENYIHTPFVSFVLPKHHWNLDLFRQIHKLTKEKMVDVIFCDCIDHCDNFHEFECNKGNDATYGTITVADDNIRSGLAQSKYFVSPLFGKFFSTEYLLKQKILHPDFLASDNNIYSLLQVKLILTLKELFYIHADFYET